MQTYMTGSYTKVCNNSKHAFNDYSFSFVLSDCLQSAIDILMSVYQVLIDHTGTEESSKECYHSLKNKVV